MTLDLWTIAPGCLAVASTAAAIAAYAGRRRERRTLLAALAAARAESRTDALTGLPTRRALAEHLTNLAAAGSTWSLVMADLDRFKHVNDTFGHAAGDRLLIEVARRLAENLAHRGRVFRLGGDEFTIVIPGPAGIAGSLVTDLAATVARPFDVVSGMPYEPAMSAGIAEHAPALPVAEVMRRADVALYVAKADPSSCAAIWSPDLPTPAAGLDRRTRTVLLARDRLGVAA